MRSQTGVVGRRTFLRTASALGAAAVLSACGGVSTGGSGSGSGGGAFPQRPVEFIIPFAPGGSTDLIGRAATKQISGPLGQSMVVVNKPGAGGAVGTKEAVDAAADGYKVALAPTSLFTITPLIRKESTGLDLAKMEIVTGLTRENLALVVPKDSPFKTIDDVLAAKGGRTLTFGHSGVGTGTQFSALVLLKQAGVNAKDVPFDGSGPAVNALLGKQIDMASTQIAESIKQVQAGQLRQLAVFSEQRSPQLPDVPTVKEKGIDLVVDQVRFVAAPKGTPPQALDKLRTSFLQSTKDPAYEEFLKSNFIERAEVPGDQVRAKIERDSSAYKTFATRLGIAPQ
ncbi:MAG: tripartite tricarboxylate transporter substrate binding protein [Actinomycetota bacterium]|nr:tripartite tricarboxylate transporter substrate binding protein [Actinomycetota bacterium]